MRLLIEVVVAVLLFIGGGGFQDVQVACVYFLGWVHRPRIISRAVLYYSLMVCLVWLFFLFLC